MPSGRVGTSACTCAVLQSEISGRLATGRGPPVPVPVPVPVVVPRSSYTFTDTLSDRPQPVIAIGSPAAAFGGIVIPSTTKLAGQFS